MSINPKAKYRIIESYYRDKDGNAEAWYVQRKSRLGGWRRVGTTYFSLSSAQYGMLVEATGPSTCGYYDKGGMLVGRTAPPPTQRYTLAVVLSGFFAGAFMVVVLLEVARVWLDMQ